MGSLPYIDIPDECCRPKPWFKDRPTKEVVKEIKNFIRETGKPYLWPGHTHTPPPKDAIIIYIDEFDLPLSCKLQDRWAPCPCCTPNHPKYRKNGKIAWFPNEHVIRILGPDCFGALNPEGHSEAMNALRVEQQREKDIHFLLNNINIVPEIIRCAGKLYSVAIALDEFGNTLRKKPKTVQGIDLWREIRDGNLYLDVERTEETRSRDGQQRTRTVHDRVIYATLSGHMILRPNLQKIAPSIEGLQEKCKWLREHKEEDINLLSDIERQNLAKTLNQAYSTLKRLYIRVNELRSFLKTQNINTLRTWGARPECRIKFYIERSGNTLYIGKTKDSKLRIDAPLILDEPLVDLPKLADITL